MTTSTAPIQRSRINIHFWQLFKSYWQNTSVCINLLLITVIMLTGTLQVCSLLALNDWNKHFFDAIQAYDKSMFFTLGISFVVIVLVISTAIAFNNYITGLLGLKWRTYLTHTLKTTWLRQIQSQRLQVLTSLDNPEQRISDDLNLMPQLTLKIANNLFQAVITLIIFGSELWILSRQWGMHYHGAIVTVPGIYLWSTLVYAIIFNILVFSLGHRLIILNYMNQKLNATFRCMMSFIREHSHNLISQETALAQHHDTGNAFNNIVTNTLAMLKVDRTIQFIRQISINASGFFILTVALSAYFIYHLQIGYLMQVNGAALFFIKGLSVLIDAYEDIAQLSASLQRAGELATSLDEVAASFDMQVKHHESLADISSHPMATT